MLRSHFKQPILVAMYCDVAQFFGRQAPIPCMEHEQAFVSAFVVPEKRARYLELLAKPKRRSEITNRFSHFFDFLPQLARQVPRNSDVAALLRKQGAGDIAHVIGGRDALDGKDMPLEEAIIKATIDPGGVVISCIPGRLALYMKEFPPGDTFILSNKLPLDSGTGTSRAF